MDRQAFPLVPGRECGACHACCQYLNIDTPQLRKPPNILCRHWNNGCGIYEDRPGPCRTFFCGWRITAYLDDDWRPDRSNIFLRVAPTESGAPGVDVNLIGELTDEMTHELLRYIGGLIESQIATYIVIPGPPGHGAAKMLLNNRMRPALQTRIYENALAAFREAVRVARAFETRPVGPSVP